jgi:F-type H+-transporting ATPase subunit delta
MKISRQARREAKNLFQAAQRNGILDESKTRQIVDHILQTKPRGYLAILSHFVRLMKLDMDRRSARVEFVMDLDEAQRSAVKTALTRQYGPGLEFTFRENAALIGGMRIQVGSDVYDGSIRSRLAQLQEV